MEKKIISKTGNETSKDLKTHEHLSTRNASIAPPTGRKPPKTPAKK